MIKSKNPTLLRVDYIRPPRRSNPPDPEAQKECFEVIYKDEMGQVHRTEEPAEADIYIVKPEFRNYNYTKPEERMEKMDKVRVPISKIRQKIADEMGDSGREFIKKCYQEGNPKGLNQLYRWPYAYGCDFQPEYYYYKHWYDKYPLGHVSLTSAFLDIEVDQTDYTVNMDHLSTSAYAPVNIMSIYFNETNEMYTFMLESQKPTPFGRSELEYQKLLYLYNRQLKAFKEIEQNPQDFINELHQDFDDVYGYINYHIRTYTEEIDMLADLFRCINEKKPNFCLCWNMRFDIQYLYYRIKALGYDPASIMCHPDFKTKKCYFTVDSSTFLIEKQYDYFYCSSYTQYICQMRLYASIRKSQHKLRSVKLNAIADRELKDRKVDYQDEGNIITFAYLDWRKFGKYNIKDVLLQVGIERKCNDVSVYYNRSHSNLTPYNKIFRETHLLRNVRELYFEKDGWVQSNNLNIIDQDEDQVLRTFYAYDDDDDEDETSFKGAINADPIWNAYVGRRISGRKTNCLFINCIDFDMGAFYPSCKIASNMDPITLLYKASFVNEEFISGEMPNRSLNTKYTEKDKYGNVRKLDITGEAVNTYVSKNTLTFCYNYLGLPGITDLYRDVLQIYNSKYDSRAA